jgi:hypothetical protein
MIKFEYHRGFSIVNYWYVAESQKDGGSLAIRLQHMQFLEA